ncbi:hypothetical protein, partial [Phormidium sp. FACHB-1136]|uniref:hypothetical protein n=1 Tax=Phormidium sp. FACHB-1136 TaxID=2692848 RepID=UPI001A7E59CD
ANFDSIPSQLPDPPELRGYRRIDWDHSLLNLSGVLYGGRLTQLPDDLVEKHLLKISEWIQQELSL